MIFNLMNKGIKKTNSQKLNLINSAPVKDTIYILFTDF